MLCATIYEKRAEFSKARDAYETVLAAEPEFAAAQNNLAYLYAERLDEPDKAYDLARKARVSQPDNGAIADTLGWVLYQRGDYQQAAVLLRESAAKLADHPEVQFHFAMSCYMMGEVASARGAFERALSLPSDFPGKQEARRRLDLLAEDAGAPLTVQDLDALLQRQPDDILVRMRLAETHEKQGAFPEAAAAYEEIIKRNPKVAKANTALARLLAGPLKNPARAFDYAKKSRELSPDDPRAAAVFGEIAYKTGNFTSAYHVLQEAARQLPNDPSVLHNLAWVAYSLGKVAEADTIMERILTAAPEGAQAVDAAAFRRLVSPDTPEEFAATEEEAEKILVGNPDYVPGLMVRAALRAQRGASQEAASTYGEILSRLPEFAPAQKHLAALYMDDPVNAGKAFDLALKARKALPDDPEIEEMLATIRYQRKEYSSALQLLQQSARTKALSPRSLYVLGMCQLQTKQVAEGRESLVQALSNGLREPHAAEAKRAVSELK